VRDQHTLRITERCRQAPAAQRYQGLVTGAVYLMHREYDRTTSGVEVVACLPCTDGATFLRDGFDGALAYRADRVGD